MKRDRWTTPATKKRLLAQTSPEERRLSGSPGREEREAPTSPPSSLKGTRLLPDCRCPRGQSLRNAGDTSGLRECPTMLTHSRTCTAGTRLRHARNANRPAPDRRSRRPCTGPRRGCAAPVLKTIDARAAGNQITTAQISHRICSRRDALWRPTSLGAGAAEVSPLACFRSCACSPAQGRASRAPVSCSSDTIGAREASVVQTQTRRRGLPEFSVAAHGRHDADRAAARPGNPINRLITRSLFRDTRRHFGVSRHQRRAHPKQ